MPEKKKPAARVSQTGPGDDLFGDLGGMPAAHRQLALAAFASSIIGLDSMASEVCRQVIAEQPYAALAWGMLLTLDPQNLPSGEAPASVAMYRRAFLNGGDSPAERTAALDVIEQLMRREPGNDYLRYRFAHACEEAGQFDRAIDMHLSLWERDGRYKAEAGNDAAYLIAEHQPEKLEQAASIIREVLEQSRNAASQPALFDTAGWIDHKRGAHDQALQKINSALLDLNRRPEVHRHVAAVYAALGNNSWRKYHLDQARVLEEKN